MLKYLTYSLTRPAIESRNQARRLNLIFHSHVVVPATLERIIYWSKRYAGYALKNRILLLLIQIYSADYYDSDQDFELENNPTKVLTLMKNPTTNPKNSPNWEYYDCKIMIFFLIFLHTRVYFKKGASI